MYDKIRWGWNDKEWKPYVWNNIAHYGSFKGTSAVPYVGNSVFEISVSELELVILSVPLS